ncbi:neuroligin-4, X-linked-like [Littorina saxatilis]|uniref:neuroligin-4, X-linked-like n=1 Tax=Littorina saxatilis TaxID=31220 RepID=UPI0038B4CD23
MENLSKTNQNVHFRVLNGTSEDSHPENLNEMNKNGDLKTLNNAAEDGYLENLNKMNKNVQHEARHHQDRNASLVTSLRSFLRSSSRLNGSLAKTSMTAVLAVLTLLQLLPWTAAVVYQKQLSSRVITTRYGKVRGILVEFPNRHLNPVEAYFGLKYADLEKGNMRFMPPKNPKEQWTKIRAAVLQQPACPQLMRHEREYQDVQPENRVSHLRNITAYLTKQQEDCLSLNLYVPMPKWNETTAMPVMVFIHGETYDSGTGNAYDGSVLSSFGDVIVVTLNYRLGVLGFLTTLDHSAMANLGLLDITQALLWLQENVASFNGDPKRVTLFGHGHGAALVNLLLLSPFMSEGRGPFFQQAIVQSGSALSNWAVSYDPLWCTEKLANKVNCTSFIGNNDELVKCLRKRSVAELLNAAPDAPKYYSCFAPAVDEWTVLPTQVEKLIKERNSKFASVPVMFGITKNEAYSYLKQQEIHKGISDFRKTQIIRTYVQNVFRYHRQKVYEILDHQYTDWTQPSTHMSNRDNILELLSDGQYVAPLIKTANYHSETADTYLYSFSYSTQSEATAPDSEEEIQGIHGDELPYVFGSPLVDGLSPFPSSYTNVEKMMSEAVMTYWTNFAKTGNPNLPRNQTSVHGDKVHNRFEGLKWPKYDVTTQQYLQIGRRPAVKHHYRGQKLAMWLDLIPKINVPDGSDPSAHMLAYANNHTTFDDYHRLIRPFDNIFPSPPPMPPISPTLSYTNDEPSTPTATPHMGGGKYPKPDLPPDDTTAADVDVTTTTVEPMTKPLPPGAKVTDTREHLTSSLSITVAVGCTLLFLNILIFAAVYYQRVRIRKLRERGEPEDPDEVRLNRKLEREANHRNCVTGPETDSLMSGGTGGVGGGSGSGRGGEEDYPTTDLGMGGGAGTTGTLNSQGTLGRRSPPQNGRKTPSGTLSRSSTLDTASSCNYAPVPTHNTSPLHRPQVHYPSPTPTPTPTTLPPPCPPTRVRTRPSL